MRDVLGIFPAVVVFDATVRKLCGFVPDNKSMNLCTSFLSLAFGQAQAAFSNGQFEHSKY